MQSPKKILIIAGPNGAGKTTFAREFLPNEAGVLLFINADLIAAGLNPFQPENEAMRAGRLMLQMIAERVRAGDSFSLETTLSGRSYARSIPQWQAQGYRVELYFLRLPSPDMAVDRVSRRVREGGHHIPEDVIRRRFDLGWRNFRFLYRDLVDSWELYDNSGTAPLLLDQKEQPMTTKQQPDTNPPAAQKPPVAPPALAAMRRAAQKARQRAIDNDGYVPTWRDGKIVHETEP